MSGLGRLRGWHWVADLDQEDQTLVGSLAGKDWLMRSQKHGLAALWRPGSGRLN
jgi:hypothetical protein